MLVMSAGIRPFMRGIVERCRKPMYVLRQRKARAVI
jgi:hypothetical protein